MTATTGVKVDQASIDAVAAAVQERWQAGGELAETFPWETLADKIDFVQKASPISVAVVLPKIQHIECIYASASEIHATAEVLESLIAAGWAITALIPINALGMAHEGLRGLPIALQGWWKGPEDGKPQFTSPEMP